MAGNTYSGPGVRQDIVWRARGKAVKAVRPHPWRAWQGTLPLGPARPHAPRDCPPPCRIPAEPWRRVAKGGMAPGKAAPMTAGNALHPGIVAPCTPQLARQSIHLLVHAPRQLLEVAAHLLQRLLGLRRTSLDTMAGNHGARGTRECGPLAGALAGAHSAPTCRRRRSLSSTCLRSSCSSRSIAAIRFPSPASPTPLCEGPADASPAGPDPFAALRGGPRVAICPASSSSRLLKLKRDPRIMTPMWAVCGACARSISLRRSRAGAGDLGRDRRVERRSCKYRRPARTAARRASGTRA